MGKIAGRYNLTDHGPHLMGMEGLEGWSGQIYGNNRGPLRCLDAGFLHMMGTEMR